MSRGRRLRKSIPPLNGENTHPLSEHAMLKLLELAKAAIPAQELNPGLRNRLRRDRLVEYFLAESPYKKHNGTKIIFVRLTDEGRRAVR